MINKDVSGLIIVIFNDKSTVEHHWKDFTGLIIVIFNNKSTVEHQWLEHGWLVYHGIFELVLEYLGKHPIAADIIKFEIV